MACLGLKIGRTNHTVGATKLERLRHLHREPLGGTGLSIGLVFSDFSRTRAALVSLRSSPAPEARSESFAIQHPE
jgi:hypothetical protein